jgi:5-methyltetrahydropteroyltriglutamate--homocysteine methyltransferase
MTIRIAAYQHGIYPRSEDVVAATRGLERGRTSLEEVEQAFADDRRDFIEVQRESGLDYHSDGLIRWQDLFRPLVEASGGLDARTLVRWFDNNSFFRAPEVTGDLTLSVPLPTVFDDDADLPAPRVATLPSPYLFSRAAQAHGDRNALMMDLTREVLRPVAESLASRGYEVIHLQEPWLPYFGLEPSDWDDFEKALMEIRDGVSGPSAILVLHAYFGDVGPYVDRLRRLPVDAVGIDFVQTDLEELGKHWDTGLLTGVLDGRSSPIESIEGTVAFARRVAETMSPPFLYLSSNCELEYLPRDIARQKVARLGEVSARLKEVLA